MILLFLACVHQPTSTAPAPALQRGEHGMAEFGGDRWGFVLATTGGGRLVVLGRMPEQDGGAGPEPSSFGNHGEEALRASLVVVDTVSGAERAIDALVTGSADGRWLVVLAEDRAWLLDDVDGQWRPVDEGGPAADLTQDGNRCLPPRTVSFSDQGTRLAYLTEGGVVVRDLPDGAPRLYATDAQIWRAWPRDEGEGVAAFQVSAEQDGVRFPQQRTSCACLACKRFAMSYGFYGWGGPDFTGIALSPGGETPATGLPVDIGQDAWILDGALVDPRGAIPPVPEGCAVIGGWSGAAALQLACGEDAALWLPGAAPLALGLPARALGQLTATHAGARALIVPSQEPGAPSRRIDLDTLAVTPGPPFSAASPSSPDGLVLVRQGEGVIAWDTVSGAQRPVPLPEGGSVQELGPRVVYLGGGGAVLVGDAQTLALPRTASVAIDPGCVIVAASGSALGFDHGPWRWTCVDP